MAKAQEEEAVASRSLAALTAISSLVLAACVSGGAASPRVASPGAASPGAAVCSETSEAGTVTVSIEDFAFDPSMIQAKVGQVIAFRNTGFESHNATLNGGGCGTATLPTGASDGLVFGAAGTYPFGCTVHTWMTGTITIGG
jgi:plastocyanin